MRHPSPRALGDTVNVYRFNATRTGGLDVDRTLTTGGAYAATPDLTAIPCRVSLEYGSRVDDQERISTINNGLIVFGQDYGLKLNDKVDWNGTILFIEGSTDMAGAGMAWGVPVSGRE